MYIIVFTRVEILQTQTISIVLHAILLIWVCTPAHYSLQTHVFDMHISVYLLPNLNYCMISLIILLHMGQVLMLVFNKCKVGTCRHTLQGMMRLWKNFDEKSISIEPMSDQKLAQLKEATDNDPQLQQLSSIIKAGWHLVNKTFKTNLYHSLVNCHCMIMLYSRVRELSFQRRCNQKC